MHVLQSEIHLCLIYSSWLYSTFLYENITLNRHIDDNDKEEGNSLISWPCFFYRNPALEDQACDRIYRVGQTKDVTIHR